MPAARTPSIGTPRPVVVEAPATVGNFGPGFDAFALALHHEGDRVELRPADEDAILVDGDGASGIPTGWDTNVAGAVVDALRAALGMDQRFEVRLHKRTPPGSGLGSSASSAGGVALAFHAAAARARLSPVQLVRAAGEGEARVSGRHYDDVAAVVLGGLAIVRPRGDDLHLTRVQPPSRLHLAMVAPRLTLPTRDMRALLPASVSRDDAVHNVGNAAALVAAFHHDDVAAVGACMDDRIAAPARAAKIPFLADVRRAALASGALGVALSGSGPAMVGVCDTRRGASAVADAMRAAVEAHGLGADAFAARPEREVMYRVAAMH